MLYLLMRVPGISAATAMASSLSSVSQEKMASREVIWDRMAPVCTQMKLYGVRPMRTERKNWDMGMFKMGAERFRNQFGVMGNSLRNNKKKNKQLLFSSTFSCSRATFSGKKWTMSCLPKAAESR